MQFKRGLKVARVFIDIPIEKSEEFIRMFGTPVGADPVPVVIARLETSAGVDVGKGAHAPSLPAKPVSAEPESKPEQKRSSRAYLMCQDEGFQDWILDQPFVRGAVINHNNFKDQADITDWLLKRGLNITSKSELDVDGPAARAFDALMTDYRFKDMVR